MRNSNWTGGPGAGLRGLGLWGSLQTQQVPRGPPAEAGARAQEAGISARSAFSTRPPSEPASPARGPAASATGPSWGAGGRAPT